MCAKKETIEKVKSKKKENREKVKEQESEDLTKNKKIKDYMISEKIPKRQREELPLLAEGNHVLWLVGYRISEYYKVETSTKRILQVQYQQNNNITW